MRRNILIETSGVLYKYVEIYSVVQLRCVFAPTVKVSNFCNTSVLRAK